MDREKLNELMTEFYGSEDTDFEGGVIEDNPALADWSRHEVPNLFDAISSLLTEIERLKGALLHIDGLSDQFFNIEVIDGRQTFLLKPGLEKFSDFIHEIASIPYEAVND